MNAKTKRFLRLALIGCAGGAALGLAAGCGSSGSDKAMHGELFPPDEAIRPVDRMVEVQSAAAARADATLNAYHFDQGAALNSLGRAKLDLMLRDDDDSLPLVVYLDVRDASGPTDKQRDAVRHYLADRGVAETQVELRDGPNLTYTRPARDGLRGLRRLEGPDDPAAASDADALKSGGLSPLPGEMPRK